MTEKRLFITWIGNIVGLLVTPLFVIWGKPSWLEYAQFQSLLLGVGVLSAAPAIYFIIKFRALVLNSNGTEDSLFDINQALSLWGMTAFLPCLLGVGHYMVTGTYIVLVVLTLLSVVLTVMFKPTK
ncbi:MAG TPA: hypothetical protein VLC91_10210 [Spongiibacteraceae bacterium]|nr:hypothetical protein [Spongiibacteraceae bacterium]